jgi:hypothetical protein
MINNKHKRRDFMKASAAAATGILLSPHLALGKTIHTLTPSYTINGLVEQPGRPPLADAVWYQADTTGQGMVYTFEKGLLAQGTHLLSDLLVDGKHLVVFALYLQEGEKGPKFRLGYKGLNQAQARIRLPLSATDQNKWLLGREGAWLKPTCGGDRVNLENVDRLTVQISHKSHQPARWCQTPFHVVDQKPEALTHPILPKGALLDEMGQRTIHTWPNRTQNTTELVTRLTRQLAEAPKQKWPASFTAWGGWNEKKLTSGTGFYSTHHDGKRWWLVDPDGFAFWSAGMDCVRSRIDAIYGGLEKALTWLPGKDSEYSECFENWRTGFNYLGANFIRAFGKEKWYDHWATISLAELRRVGFNTVANWSEWEISRKAQFPYVIPLNTRMNRSKMVYRDFPDVFHPDFQADAKDYGEQLRWALNDKALIGYFLMNEPTWGFSTESPAMGMLYNTPECRTREELAAFMGKRYASNQDLAKAWGIETSFDEIARGKWTKTLTAKAREDLYAFSEEMVSLYFGSLSEACKAVDPQHLNLGIRYQGVPPTWTVKGMSHFDVFSMNSYTSRVPMDTCEEIHKRLNLPVLIGEYHFGALDAGLPSPGLVHVKTQADRGRAYRYYMEDAAANPFCVGAHYFTLYDQSAMGRFDGENYNIGFLDTCNKPYDDLCDAARVAHEKMYALAEGRQKPFNDPPDYLPRLF